MESKDTCRNVPDSWAFEILVREHHKRLIAYALSLTGDENTAEDLVQESFVTAFRKIDSFDTAKSFPAWLRGIIRYKHLEYLRSRKETYLDEDQLNSLEESHQLWDSSGVEDSDLFHFLAECIRKLPEILIVPLRYFYYGSMSGAEVAVKIQCNEATVRKRLQRARSELEICINSSISGTDYKSGTDND
jgi:RNA polymerase sigma-70 factor (ECF subfamily)